MTTTCDVTKLYPAEDLCYHFPSLLALRLLHSLSAEVNPVPSAFPNKSVFSPFVALCACPPRFLNASAHSWMQRPSKAPAGSRERGTSTTRHLLSSCWSGQPGGRHRERLRDGGWLSLELRQLWGDPTAAPKERVMDKREPGCSQPSGKTKGNGREVN